LLQKKIVTDDMTYDLFISLFSQLLFFIFRVPFQPTGTNIVTNTAPTPGVRMRVVRSNGETASMVGLGEDLQLRIEIDQVKIQTPICH
jgi:hypothetical protein